LKKNKTVCPIVSARGLFIDTVHKSKSKELAI
jgi:hypothetical protein